MKPPTYISMIHENTVFLRSFSKEVKLKLRENNIQVSSKYLAGKVIHVKESINETLIKLNDLGILFGEDYKQGWSPADIMREFQENGLLKKSFNSIYWVGSDKWKLKENKVVKQKTQE